MGGVEAGMLFAGRDLPIGVLSLTGAGLRRTRITALVLGSGLGFGAILGFDTARGRSGGRSGDIRPPCGLG